MATTRESDLMDLSIAIGVAYSALKLRIQKSYSKRDYNLCAAYGWLILTIEGGIRMSFVSEKSKDMFILLAEKNKGYLDNVMKIILDFEPVELYSSASLKDFKTELSTMETIVRTSCLNCLKHSLSRIIGTFALIDCKFSVLRDIIEVITDHINNSENICFE